MKRAYKILSTLIALSLSSAAFAASNPGIAGSVVGYGASQPTIGQGYSTDRTMPAAHCLKGSYKAFGSPKGFINVDKNVSIDQVRETLNKGISGGIHIGNFFASASAIFLNSTSNTNTSQSFIYETDFQGKSLEYLFPDPKPLEASEFLNFVGNQYLSNPVEFRRYCGDSFYNRFDMGGRLFFEINMNFASESDKASFDKKLALGYQSIGTIATAISSDTQSLDQRGTISIRALQVGGDPRLLGEILGVPQSGQAAPISSCSFKNATACEGMIKTMINYATTQFPKQISESADPTKIGVGQAIIHATTESYSNISGITLGPRVVNSEIGSARDYVASEYAALTANIDAAKKLANVVSPEVVNYHSLLKQYLKKAEYNAQVVRQTGITCFEDPQSCIAAVTNVKSKLLVLDSAALLKMPETYTTNTLSIPMYHTARATDLQEVYALKNITVGGFPADMTLVRLVGGINSAGAKFDAISNLITPKAGTPGPLVATVTGQVIDNVAPLTGRLETIPQAMNDFLPIPYHDASTPYPDTQSWSLVFSADFPQANLVTPTTTVVPTSTSANLTLTGTPLFNDPQTTQFKAVLTNGVTQWCTPGTLALNATRSCQMTFNNLTANTDYTATVYAYAGNVLVGQQYVDVHTSS